MNEIICGDCIEELKKLEENSVDSIVTDPPYDLTPADKRDYRRGYPHRDEDNEWSSKTRNGQGRSAGGFMGKEWDGTGIAFDPQTWKEALRVLKPGGYLLSFGGTRTYHRMACAIEDAGFEIRDMVEWIYASGFPKSLNIGKAVDKLQRNEREIFDNPLAKKQTGQKKTNALSGDRNDNLTITKGTSAWEGYGTALKPAHEPICLARKPLSEKSVASNVLKWGTGGINIDGSRVRHNEPIKMMKAQDTGHDFYKQAGRYKDVPELKESGRFPANLIHDGSDEVVGLFPNTVPTSYATDKTDRGGLFNYPGHGTDKIQDTTRSAARFFYCAKASKGERNRGLEGFEDSLGGSLEGGNDKRKGDRPQLQPTKNNHPTVKPISLMRYLIKLVTPPKGTVLDPFMGSGSTGIACKLDGFDFIGIDKEEEYVKIAEARLAAAKEELKLL